MKRKDILSLYPEENGNTIIEMRLKSSSQLYNTFDPSPFHEKDLDDDAEEYIVASVRELRGVSPLVLRIHLPSGEFRDELQDEIRNALKNYFHYRSRVIAGQLRDTFGYARIGLAIGLGFLGLSIVVRQTILPMVSGFLFEILQEGLLILGWVSMWAPVQTFLYDWWPIRQTYRLYQQISRMKIEFRQLVESHRD